MDIAIDKDESDPISYIYMQDLPWSACQDDIVKFFSEYQIVEGGVMIHGTKAFIAVNLETALDALRKNGDLLHGHPVQISLVDCIDLNKIVISNVRRKLDFNNCLPEKPCIFHQRKIRPTPVRSFRTYSCTLFSINEVEHTCMPTKKVERSFSCGSREARRLSCGRKIQPTNMDSSSEWEKLPVFHPKCCSGNKKMRLDDMSRSVQ